MEDNKATIATVTVNSEAEEIENNPGKLMALLDAFAHQRSCAISRKARLEELMQRRSTRKWKPEKTARMVRRLSGASQSELEADGAIDQISRRLEVLNVVP